MKIPINLLALIAGLSFGLAVGSIIYDLSPEFITLMIIVTGFSTAAMMFHDDGVPPGDYNDWDY